MLCFEGFRLGSRTRLAFDQSISLFLSRALPEPGRFVFMTRLLDDAQNRSLAVARLRLDDDLNISPENIQKTHEPLKGKSFQLTTNQGRHLRLIDTQQRVAVPFAQIPLVQNCA